VSSDEQARIDRYLRESGLTARQNKVVALTGDASTRRYFRVIPAGGPSIVLALHDGAIDVATLPFVAVARLLSRMPLPVPGILGHSDPLGILALDDLGDVTLQSHLGAGTLTEHDALYRQAVTFIGVLQTRGAELLTPSDGPAQLAFDVPKLTWEMDYFVKHFVEGYRGARLPPAGRAVLSDEWAHLVGELAGEPRVLCHRDYHSRNLMVHGGLLYVIDFQDARMGPDTYDLASLSCATPTSTSPAASSTASSPTSWPSKASGTVWNSAAGSTSWPCSATSKRWARSATRRRPAATRSTSSTSRGR